MPARLPRLPWVTLTLVPQKSDRVGASGGGAAEGAERGERRGLSGRVTPKGGRAAAPGRPAQSGRYTPPIPKERRHSPLWFGVVLLALMVLGLLLIVLNYVGVLPSGTHNYYLIAGIVAIVAGLVMATFYH